jgi:hypothetical protein
MAKSVGEFVEAKKGRRSGMSYVRRDAEFWRELIVAWRNSGRGVKAFCRDEGVAASTFAKWRHRLESPQRANKDADLQVGDFIAVPVAEASAAQIVQAVVAEQEGSQPTSWDDGSLGAKTQAGSTIEVVLPGMRLKLAGAHADRLMRILVTRLTRAGF